MIALVVVKIYAVTLSIGFSRRFSPKSGFDGIKGGLLTLGTCPPKGVFTITFLTHVLNFRKIGQKLWSLSWTKRFADTHTNTHTDKHTSDFISVQCHELHWTDNNAVRCMTRLFSVSDEFHLLCTKVGITPHRIDATLIYALRRSVHKNFALMM